MKYHLKDDSCKFAYFFDGVDEVSAKDFINCINSIKEVASYLDTFSIFLTSRLDTMNYPLIETRLDKVQKYSIASLGINWLASLPSLTNFSYDLFFSNSAAPLHFSTASF